MEEKSKISFLESIFIFTIGSLLGFVIESVFYIIKYGEYVNKQGLIFGPFKPIYGLGCLLITIIYYMLKRKTNLNIFIWGIVSGTIFEYIASLFIEKVFNSYIWSYKDFNMNLNGRIYLPYCIAWGIISLIWIRLLYPPLKRLFDNFMKSKPFKIAFILLSIFIIFDIFFTGLVLFRQGYRNKNNFIFKIIDKVYNEEDIVKKFPKFRPLK